MGYAEIVVAPIGIGLGRLILLRHDFRVDFLLAMGVAQQGHRGKLCTRPTSRRRRMVAIESGTWRSGRSGSAPRAPALGNFKFRDIPGAIRFAGGKGGSLADEKAVSRDA